MSVTQEQILQFMELVENVTEYTAYYFIKRNRTLDEAIGEYYDRGCPDIDEPKGYKSVFNDAPAKPAQETKPAVKKTGGNAALMKAFEECNEQGEISSREAITQFCQKLGINEDGIEMYILGYLGNCLSFEKFRKENIEAIGDRIQGNVKEECVKIFTTFSDNEYYKFLKTCYLWLKRIVNESERTQDKITMIEVLDDIYRVLLKEEMLGNVYTHLIEYITKVDKETLKKKYIQVDSFCYMPNFLKAHPTLESLKMSQDQIDDFVSYPDLYTSFLEHYNSKQKK